MEHREATQTGTDHLLHLALQWRRGQTGLQDAHQTQHVKVVVRVYEEGLHLQASAVCGEDAAAQEVVQHLGLTTPFYSVKLNDITWR